MRKGKPLSDHKRDFHPEGNHGINDYKMEVTGIFDKPLRRLVAEGVKLDKLVEKREEGRNSTVIIMNSISNYHQTKRVKFKPTTSVEY